MSVAKSCPPTMPKSMVRKAKSTTPKIGGRAGPQPALPREPQSGGALRVKLLFTESSELRKNTPPSSILFHKNIGPSLLRAELFSDEFSIRRSQPGNNGSVPVDTNANLIGLHHLVAQIARFDHSKETCLVNDCSVGVDDNPVVGKKSSNPFGIVF